MSIIATKSQMAKTPSFRNSLAFLSNMYLSPIDGFVCLETAYQASKTTNAEDYAKFKNLTGQQAKQLGRLIEIRDDWAVVKLLVMEKLLLTKFSNKQLQARLLALDTDIVERNTWGDTYWGVCDGVGENNLGKLLTKVKKFYQISSEGQHA